MRPSFTSLAFAGLALATSLGLDEASALAQTADPCLSAPIDGQQAQRAGKLLEARTSYLACSSQSCPKVIVSDCEHWLREVEDALPSVILAARDSQGNDLLDARISIDGAAPVSGSTLGVPIDPGQHRFVFHREGAADIEQRALLRAGEKNREIVAVFAAPQSAALPAPVPVTVERPVPVAAWVVAGIGVAAFAFFGTFGALGVSERSADGCATGCPTNEKSQVDTKFVVADVSLVAGVLALGAATWIYFARPAITAPAHPAAFFDFRLAPGGGVGLLTGRF